MLNVKPIKWPVLLMASLFSFNVHAATIYCEDNKQMQCLGFGEKVVKSNAICFDPLKCGQDGFVCKSELDTLAAEHESLLNQHNDLVNTHNQLIDTYESSQADYERLHRCVAVSTTLEEAKNCQ